MDVLIQLHLRAQLEVSWQVLDEEIAGKSLQADSRE